MNSNIDSKFKKLAICLSIFAVLVIGRILFLQTNASAVELKETIGKAVLAASITREDAPEGAYTKDWSINGEDAKIGVMKL